MPNVSTGRVAKVLSGGGYSRAIRITGAPGYEITRNQEGHPVVSAFAPAGHEQPFEDSAMLEFLGSAGFQVEDGPDGVVVTGLAVKRSPAVVEELPDVEPIEGETPAQTTSRKLKAYWQSHQHPMKGVQMGNETKKAIAERNNARRALVQAAVNFYRDALTSGQVTLPEELMAINPELLDAVASDLASGDPHAARRRYQEARQARLAAAKAAERAAAAASNGNGRKSRKGSATEAETEAVAEPTTAA